MGIKGLLPVLNSITKSINIKEYKGKTIGVDAYCWLHKAAYSCAKDICLGKKNER